jgi:hypothetical protein
MGMGRSEGHHEQSRMTQRHKYFLFLALVFVMAFYFVPVHSSEPAAEVKEAALAHANTLLVAAKQKPENFELVLTWRDHLASADTMEGICREQFRSGVLQEATFKDCQTKAHSLPDFWLASYKRIQNTLPSFTCEFAFDLQNNPIEWFNRGCGYNK